MFDIPTFRINFPEFADVSVYPDSVITLWLTLAQQMLPQCVWKSTWVLALSLYVAHELVIASQNVRQAVVGGSPGQQGGIANSKTVGGVNVGYDTQSQTEKDAGWYNRTTYGIQLYRLIKIFGAGCVQL